MDIYYPILLVIIFIILCIPGGKYLSTVISYEKNPFDRIFDPVDNLIYKVTGITKEDMNWKEYSKAILFSNLFAFFITFLVFKFQYLFHNNAVFNSALSFNSAASFATNTNLQNYSGEDAGLITTLVIIFQMFFSAATGFSAASAFIRGLAKEKGLGNFFMDITRIITRVLLPIAVIISVILIINNVNIIMP